MKVCFNLKCSFVFLCIFFSLKIAISAFSHSHIWSKFFHSSEENWLKCFCGGTAKSLRMITAVLWAVVAPRSAPLKSWWHFCRLCNIFFLLTESGRPAVNVWEKAMLLCFHFLLINKQGLCQTPLVCCCLGRKSNFQHQCFLRWLCKAWLRLLRKGGKTPYDCIEVADDYH